VRSGVSVQLTVRVEEKVIDLVSRRDRLPSAPFTPGSSYTPCAVASRRRGARNDPRIAAGADGRMVFAKTHRAITGSRHEDGPPRALRSRHIAATLRFLHEEQERASTSLDRPSPTTGATLQLAPSSALHFAVRALRPELRLELRFTCAPSSFRLLVTLAIDLG
jgi:hypothetical protein